MSAPGELPENLRHVLMKIVGARLGKCAFMLKMSGAGDVWIEAHRSKKLWVPLKQKPRVLMASQIDQLIALGRLEKINEDGAIILKEIASD